VDTTAYLVTDAHEPWCGDHHMLELCCAVEKALNAKPVEAIDSGYLAELRNLTTGCYGETITDVHTDIVSLYRHVTPQLLKAREADILSMTFDMSHPVDLVFKSINDRLELSDLANMKISSKQAVNLAYIVFAKSPVLL